MSIRRTTGMLGIAALALGLPLATAPGAAAGAAPAQREFMAHLRPVPHDPAKDGGSEVNGIAHVERMGTRVDVMLRARGLSPSLQHLVHIHGDIDAKNECPDSLLYDTDHDGLISVPEGATDIDADHLGYGPVQVSLTNRGDVSAASGGAFERMPFAGPGGRIRYHREFMLPTAVTGESPAAVARHLGQMHMVIHGDDINHNGAYDDATEASLPVACGPLHMMDDD